jgi:hypothetical protein
MYMHQLSGGFRYPSPQLAARIEKVSAEMHHETDGWLPKIYRTDLCKACRVCDLARDALGVVAQRSDFVSLEISRATFPTPVINHPSPVMLTITDLSEGSVSRFGSGSYDEAKKQAVELHSGNLAWSETNRGFLAVGGDRHYFITLRDSK